MNFIKYFLKEGNVMGFLFLMAVSILVFVLEMIRASEHWYLVIIFVVVALIVGPGEAWWKYRKIK